MQEQSLFGLEKKNDSIVKMLYAVSKNSTDEKTVHVLLDVCNNTGNQFKRNIDTVEQDGPDMKRIKQYALDGARSTSYISKYLLQGSSGSAMPEPISLPTNIEPSANYQVQQILKEIPIMSQNLFSNCPKR